MHSANGCAVIDSQTESQLEAERYDEYLERIDCEFVVLSASPINNKLLWATRGMAVLRMSFHGESRLKV